MSYPIPNFTDTKLAFQYKSKNELRITHFVFKLFTVAPLVKILSACAEWILRYHLPGKFLIKNTVFKVFCAGENLTKAFQTINQLHTYQVKSVLDYVSESEANDDGYRQNAKRIIANIETLANQYSHQYISIKITGLENYDFLKLMSLPNHAKLTTENKRLLNLYQRIDDICAQAAKHQVSIYFDAEEYCTQAIYDWLVEEMMAKYNTQKAIIYNTLQMYLTDRVTYLYQAIEKSKQKGYYLGIKIVRGAYLEKEHERALLEGKKSPVFKSKAETDLSFNTAIDICLNQLNTVYLCIASHNEESILYALNEMNRLHIPNATAKVSFSQLLGMSDHLTFNLAHAGYEVSKYLPYGELEKAIPYLIRRANENKSVEGHVNREYDLLQTEISRRYNHA